MQSTWQLIKYMDDNPQASVKEIMNHFAVELEVDKHIESLKTEVDQVLALREQLRPLYAEKIQAEQAIVGLNSEFDMDVMIKYPPRQGTEKERKAHKLELQKNSEQFQMHQETIDRCKEKIEMIEEELYEVEERAKNGRKILDLFTLYFNYVLSSQAPPPVNFQATGDEPAGNINIF